MLYPGILISRTWRLGCANEADEMFTVDFEDFWWALPIESGEDAFGVALMGCEL